MEDVVHWRKEKTSLNFYCMAGTSELYNIKCGGSSLKPTPNFVVLLPNNTNKNPEMATKDHRIHMYAI
jgi:hypothetical protein